MALHTGDMNMGMPRDISIASTTQFQPGQQEVTRQYGEKGNFNYRVKTKSDSSGSGFVGHFIRFQPLCFA